MEIRALAQQAVGSEALRLPRLARLWGQGGGTTERRLADIGKYLLVAAQVGLLVIVMRQFRIEHEAFYNTLALLIFAGFLVHHWLPLRFRLPFFLLLSLAGIGLVMGVGNGLWLVGIGLGLIGICHLPISFRARTVLLLAAGLLLAALRVEWIPNPLPLAVWPILASIFMFRLILYLYDLRHDKGPKSIWRTLSYFFLLPNVAFPLFPVVDFAAFRRTYYDGDPYWIYQRGVQWMFRGITQLIAYRVVYYWIALPQSDVSNGGEIVRFLLSNYALYLRISGQFHLIVGILHLFGFNLPETHHLYFLASSFTEFWRRINIYWKDFMMKVFYYPAYFSLRKRGATAALVLSTLFVFVMTWFFHSYQWFWLRGSFLLSWPDLLFWAILALLLVANSLHEAKHGRERSLGQRSWSVPKLSIHILQTAVTFAIICVLWSLWTSPTIGDWLGMWSVVEWSPQNLVGFVPVFLVASVAFGGRLRFPKEFAKPFSAGRWRPSFFRTALVTCGLILLFSLFGRRMVYSRFGPLAQEVMDSVRETELSKTDATLLERGYYENLVGVSRFNSQLWEVYAQRPRDWKWLVSTEAMVERDDFLAFELRPSVEMVYHGAAFHTNRWGMRDREYTKSKPPGTYRIALLGASTVMGSGVANDETFEALLEERLNREQPVEGYDHYDILNFAVEGYAPPQQLMVLEEAFSFDPDAVFFVTAPSDRETTVKHLAEQIERGVTVPYDYLRETAEKAGVTPETRRSVSERRLQPYDADMLSWIFRQTVQESRERGIEPVWIYLPMPGTGPGSGTQEKNIPMIVRLAREAGFLAFDLSELYKGQNLASLWVAEWDRHPNARGHQLIADRLYPLLLEHREIFSPGPAMEEPDSPSAQTAAQ